MYTDRYQSAVEQLEQAKAERDVLTQQLATSSNAHTQKVDGHIASLLKHTLHVVYSVVLAQAFS